MDKERIAAGENGLKGLEGERGEARVGLSGDSKTPLNRARITTHSPGNGKQPLRNCSIFGGDKLQLAL